MESLFNNFQFNAISDFKKITCIDMHTGGEPLRIPIDGLPKLKGSSVLEKRRYFQKHYDHIRTGLMFEPKGHADMYGAIISAPTTAEADFDVFFIHNEGYSTMCGHAIIALTKFVFESQLILPKIHRKLTINVPAGVVKSEAHFEKDKVVESSFVNVPSFLYLRDKTVVIDELETINFDVAYGGAFYAIVNADDLKLSLDTDNFYQLIDYGKKIKKAVIEKFEIHHPSVPELSYLYGTIFTGKAKNDENHSRNVCIFAEAELDRSATGSGVSARAGLHYAKGELSINEKITVESILGSTMTVEVIDTLDFHGYSAVIPKVTGTAFYTGKNEFWFDPHDPYKKGFIFR